jgi:hypothetical protein
VVANNESHARKLACKGMAFVIRECCKATLFIYLSLATTYIETPAFAGVSMYCKYNKEARRCKNLLALFIITGTIKRMHPHHETHNKIAKKKYI